MAVDASIGAAEKPRPSRRQAPERGAASVGRRLLAWYDLERRELPWRYPPGQTADPYRVWLSEVMLQQTTVKAVAPYFEAFTRRWPTVGALAAAHLDDVLTAWAGLGYYSRARNLHACAKVVTADHGGVFPSREAALAELPGIGPYTAAAIASIAFGRRATPVDGNVERVVARLFAIERPLPAAKTELAALASTLTPQRRAGDFAQAMMDLGATVCTPRRPSCLMCPLATGCKAREAGLAERLPARAAKAERPTRFGIAFLALREDGRLLLRQRDGKGLLASMIEVPSTSWVDTWPAEDEALQAAPVNASWWRVPGVVTHVFTHFRLELLVYRAIVPVDAQLTFWANAPRCRWVSRRALGEQALPSVMTKLIAHAMKDG
ncbi:MAG TPA: A/G-specific adenine glycosylase [Hyphomicrobiaceae bacterium]|nr:A/G-specific adenine glycosylase [Hyphomicrobiaceae bacterium]